MKNRLLLAAGAVALASPAAFAQNMAGVFGPVVDEGHSSAQYRLGHDPDADRFAHRLHYQQSLNGDFMLRGVIQSRETAESDFDFDFIGAELFWQLTDDGQDWQSGLRFDVRLRDDDRPGNIGAHWSNQWALGDGWRARAVIMSFLNFGDNAPDGVFLQTRGQIHKALDGGNGIGFEIFSAYGSTENFADFDDQIHQIGPYISIPVTKDWEVFASALFGATDATSDANLKFWLTRSF